MKVYLSQERDWHIHSIVRMFTMSIIQLSRKFLNLSSKENKIYQKHKNHYDCITQRKLISMGIQYINFFGWRRTGDPQGRNFQTNCTLVGNVRSVWNQQFLSRKAYITIKRSKVKAKCRKPETVEWLFKSQE